MDNLFYRPYLSTLKSKETFFPYDREKLCERPIFPTYIIDTGAALCMNDLFKTTSSDELLRQTLSGELFKHYEFEGKFHWHAIYKKFNKTQSTPQWEGHIWLSRLYILLPLAQAYLKTNEKKYADVWYKILSDWIENNPYTVYPADRKSGEWFDMVWYDMQVAWRTINLVHSIFMFGKNNPFSKEQWEKIYSAVKIHTDHMYEEVKEMETGRLLDNHQLQIGMALIMVGTLMPEIGESDRYIHLGKHIVGVNLEKTISEDGINEENSTSYAHFIARMYVEAELLLKYNNYDLIEGCAEKIQKQYEFLYQFSSPDGKNLLIGDAYCIDALEDVEFVNSIYPLNFERKKKSVVFSSGGMMVLRNNHFELFIDAMAPNYTMKPYIEEYKTWGGLYGNHQHFGRPTFVLFGDGEELVSDSGALNYDRSGLRCRINSVEGHNALCCDEIPLEHDLTITYATEELEILSFENSEGCQKISIKNTVLNDDGKNYIWTRNFELYEEKLKITDVIEASEKMHFKSYLHLPNTVTGYIDYQAKMQPLSDDEKVINLRRNEKLQTVKTDTKVKTAFYPCVNYNNKIDYCESVLREWFDKAFSETTEIFFR